MIVLPGRGFNVALNATGAGGTAFGVLGAFSAGDVIVRLYVAFTMLDAGVGVFAATLGGSSEASQAALDSGSSVVSRSGTVIGGVPALRFQVAAGLFGAFVVPVGFTVSSGSRFMVIGWTPSNTLAAHLIVGAEVVRVLKNASVE